MNRKRSAVIAIYLKPEEKEAFLATTPDAQYWLRKVIQKRLQNVRHIERKEKNSLAFVNA